MKYMRKLFQNNLLILIILIGLIPAQSVMTLGLEGGGFVQHTDNDLFFTKNNNLDLTWGFNTGIIHQQTNGSSLYYQLGHFNGTAKGIIRSTVTDEFGNVLGEANLSNLSYNVVPIEVTWIPKHDSYLVWGVGVSMVLNSRAMILHNYFSNVDITDRLFSVGAGPHLAILWHQPLSQSEGASVLFSTKLKWVPTIWYDKSGRDVSDYHQSYIHISATVSLCFSAM